MAAAVVLAAGLTVFLLWPEPDLRAGSEVLEEGDFDAGSRTLEAYEIVYRIEDHSPDGVHLSTEHVLVRRPFEARVEVLKGPPPGGEQVSLNVYGFGRLGVRGEVLAVPPGPPVADRRAGSLEELVSEGYAAQRELRRIASRPCRIYRLAGGTTVTGLAPVSDAQESFTELCFDEAGLVLEEVSYVDGEIRHRKLAEVVDEAPAVDDASLRLGLPSLPPDQGGSLQLLEPTSRLPGDRFWEVSDPLEGLEMVDRYAVVPPGQPGLAEPAGMGAVEAFLSEVWSGGGHVVAIEQGAVSAGAPFEDDPSAQRVSVGELGGGELRFGLLLSEVRVRMTGGSFVRVRGTLPPSRVLEIARSLVAVEGGDLVIDPGIGPRRGP